LTIQSEARKAVLEALNSHKPQFPPDVYFVRRNPRLLDRYMRNPTEFDELVKESSPAQKLTYKLFSLDEYQPPAIKS